MAGASDTAYSTLRSEIVEWQLQPGAVLAEVEQSIRLGISRTPVREALARLAADGLVEPLGGRGLVVAPISRETVIQLFELRSALERQAASLAALRRDLDVFRRLREEFREVPALLSLDDPARHRYYDMVARFDGAMDDAVANPYLVAALAGVRTHVARIRRLARDNPQRLLDAAIEHLLIIDAIIDGDALLASDATHVHLHRSLDAILQSLEVADAAQETSKKDRK